MRAGEPVHLNSPPVIRAQRAPNGQRPLRSIERGYHSTFYRTEKPLRYDRISGLDAEQPDELVLRVDEQLDEPWDKGIGRPEKCYLKLMPQEAEIAPT